MKRKKLVALVCALTAVLSINAAPVSAANTEDMKYEYTVGNNALWHSTNARNKTNTSKVYVKPAKSPSKKTKVQTYCYAGGTKVNKTKKGTVTLSNGQAYGITNYVYEQGDKKSGKVSMWLRVKPTSGVGVTNGVWSPDWSGKTSVKIV